MSRARKGAVRESSAVAQNVVRALYAAGVVGDVAGSVCCSVLQCFAVYCSVLQWGAVGAAVGSGLQCVCGTDCGARTVGL